MGPAAPDPNSKMLIPSHAGPRVPAGRPVAERGRADQSAAEVEAGTAGAGWPGDTRETAPDAARTCTNDVGNRSTSPSFEKKPRAASCRLARISRGEFAGASMRLVSHATS